MVLNKFKNGDKVRVLSTGHILSWYNGKKAVNYQFNLNFSNRSEQDIEIWNKGLSNAYCLDPNNTYQINYMPQDLQLVNKSYEIWY